jgi:hypothetical protein
MNRELNTFPLYLYSARLFTYPVSCGECVSGTRRLRDFILSKEPDFWEIKKAVPGEYVNPAGIYDLAERFIPTFQNQESES